MIDIDKYEGHTPAPWKAFEDIEGADTETPYRTGAWSVGNAVIPLFCFDDEIDPHLYNEMGICLLHTFNQNNEANAKLIADAPLLLREVKRLRGLLDEIDDVVYYNDKKAGQVLPVEKPNLELLRDIMMSYADEAYQIRGDEGEWIE